MKNPLHVRWIFSGWWFGTWLLISIIYGIILPIGIIYGIIFFKMVIAPPTSFFWGLQRSVAFRQGMQAAELWTCGSLRAADRSSSHQDAWPVTIFIVATEVDMGHLTLQKPIMSSNLPHLSGIYMDLWMLKMLKSVNRGWTPKPRRGYATGCSSQEFWNTHTQRFGMSCGGWGSNKSVSLWRIRWVRWWVDGQYV